MRTNKTKFGGILLALAMCAGCVSASASDDASITKSVSFMPPVNVPAGISGTTTQSTTADISGALNSLGNLGSLSLSFPVDTVSDPTGNSLSWLNTVSVSIVPVNQPLLTPIVLSNDGFVSDSSIGLSLTGDTNTLIQYLETSGGVRVIFTLTGSFPTEGINLDWTLTAHANVSVNKGI